MWVNSYYSQQIGKSFDDHENDNEEDNENEDDQHEEENNIDDARSFSDLSEDDPSDTMIDEDEQQQQQLQILEYNNSRLNDSERDSNPQYQNHPSTSSIVSSIANTNDLIFITTTNTNNTLQLESIINVNICKIKTSDKIINNKHLLKRPIIKENINTTTTTTTTNNNNTSTSQSFELIWPNGQLCITTKYNNDL